MNLCLETAPNVLTTPWEGGATRQGGLGMGTGGWCEVPPRLARPCRTALRRFAAEGPAAKGL